MKVNRLDAHDRLLHVTSQGDDIGKTCQDIINKAPFGNHPFYIFAHKRTIAEDERIGLYNEDMWASIADPFYKRKYVSAGDVPTHRLIWQPRLTKPKAQSNSMLFKAYPGSDNIKIIWMLPDETMWDAYDKGKMTENQTVKESIEAFKNHKNKLESPEEDDYDDEAIDKIYKSLSRDAASKILSRP